MKKKVSKAKLLRRLKNLADKLWSQYIHLRDGVCQMCGATEKLAAHHCIVRKALSNHSRWLPDNGILLCFKCHILGVHHEGTRDFLKKFVEILDKMFTPEQQQRVKDLSKEKSAIDLARMEETVAGLKAKIAELKPANSK